MDIHEALDRVNELSPTKLFTLNKRNYWYYDLVSVELNEVIIGDRVPVMSGSGHLVTVFLLGMIAGMTKNKNRENGE
jgi:hypothetical protein